MEAASYGKDVPPRVRWDDNFHICLLMKLTPLRSRILFTASCLALPALAMAQSPASPPALATPPSLPPTAELPVAKKLSAFKSPAGPLKTVVDSLQKMLLTQNLEPINILIAPDAEGMVVPELDLRNVSGTEALSLIASAASCLLQPVYTPDATGSPYLSSIPGSAQTIVGYKLQLPQSAMRGGGRGSVRGALPGGGGDAKYTQLVQSTPDKVPSAGSPAARNGVTPQGLAITEGAPGIGGVVGFGGGGAMPGSAASNSDIQTRVYPLATIEASTAFGEIMKTLEDLLTTAGVAKDQVKLAFHEKTNVLILRGPAEAQAVVEQLLTALDQNFAKTSGRAAEMTVTSMKIKVEAMAAEIENLRKRLEDAENQRRHLERENQRLQDQVPQKIDRK